MVAVVMGKDVLIVVEDNALRGVFEIALSMDGYRVRTAVSEGDARDFLARKLPGVVILDMTAPFSEAVLFLLHRAGASIPHVLLMPAWGDWTTPNHPAGRVLEMPFGLAEFRRALASVAASTHDA